MIRSLDPPHPIFWEPCYTLSIPTIKLGLHRSYWEKRTYAFRLTVTDDSQLRRLSLYSMLQLSVFICVAQPWNGFLIPGNALGTTLELTLGDPSFFTNNKTNNTRIPKPFLVDWFTDIDPFYKYIPSGSSG